MLYMMMIYLLVLYHLWNAERSRSIDFWTFLIYTVSQLTFVESFGFLNS